VVGTASTCKLIMALKIKQIDLLDAVACKRKRETSLKQRNRLLKAVVKGDGLNKQQRMEEAMSLLTERMVVNGAYTTNIGTVVVAPIDAAPLVCEGELINYTVVSAYLNLLSHAAKCIGVPLRLGPENFLVWVKRLGWEGVRRAITTVKLGAPDWDQEEGILFISGFLGPEYCGHWTAIIVKSNPAGRTILFIDSLRCHSNEKEVRDGLTKTPFSPDKDDNSYHMIDCVRQAAGSNDCAVFMLLTFTAFLRKVDVDGSESVSLRNMTPQEFGRKGRQHILQSIWSHNMDLDDECINQIMIT
jgi:hypothetical protein